MRAIEMYGDSGEEIRAAVATVSNGVRHGENCNLNALITFTNDLDQNVTFTTQGMNKGDSTWQTVATDIVAAGGVGSRSVTAPWGLLRISALPAGVPSTGTVQARYTGVQA